MNLEAIKKRLAIATNGPHKPHPPAYPDSQTCVIYDSTGNPVCEVYRNRDTDFFGNAWLDIKMLIEEVETLQKALDDLRNAAHQSHSSNSNY